MTTLAEDLARTLHDEQCTFPWDTGTDAHKDEWRAKAERYLAAVKQGVYVLPQEDAR